MLRVSLFQQFQFPSKAVQKLKRLPASDINERTTNLFRSQLKEITETERKETPLVRQPSQKTIKPTPPPIKNGALLFAEQQPVIRKSPNKEKIEPKTALIVSKEKESEEAESKFAPAPAAHRTSSITLNPLPPSLKNTQASLASDRFDQKKTELKAPSIRRKSRQTLEKFLKRVSYPISFIDFEGFFLHQNLFKNYPEMQCHSKKTLPFQVSIHRVFSECELLSEAKAEHYNYLAPTLNLSNTLSSIEAAVYFHCKELAEFVLKHTKEDDCLMVYDDSFEKSVFDIFTILFPEFKPALELRKSHILDLQSPFASPAGACSLKTLADEIVPDLSFKGLPISKGKQASKAYRNLCRESPERQVITRENLRIYSDQDTYVMPHLLNFLNEGQKQLPTQDSSSCEIATPERESKPRTVKTLIMVDDPNSREVFDEVLKSGTKHGLEADTWEIVCVNGKDPWDIPTPKVDVLILFNHPGFDHEANRRLISFIKYFVEENCKVKFNLPFGENAEEKTSFYSLSQTRKKWRSNFSTTIANAVEANSRKELLMKDWQVTQLIQEIRTGELIQTPRSKRRESLVSRANAAYYFFRNAKPLVWPPKDFEKIKPIVWTLIHYYRDLRSLSLPLPPTILCARLPHPDLNNGVLHPTSLILYARSWHYRINEYSNLPLLSAIKEHRSLKYFRIQVKGDQYVVASDVRTEKEILLTLEDSSISIKIELLDGERVKNPHRYNDILLTSVTQIHRTFHKESGHQLRPKKGKIQLKSKCARGIAPGAFFLAHIDGDPETVFITEGVEEALTLKEAIVRLPSVRLHYGIKGNFAIIATLAGPDEICFPKCTKKVIRVLDNDGIRPEATEKIAQTVASLLKKVPEVRGVMAFSDIVGGKIDFNDILVKQGLDALGSALCQDVPIVPKLFHDVKHPLELTLKYQQVIQELKQSADSSQSHLRAGKLAYQMGDFSRALRHVEEGILATLSQEQSSSYIDLLYQKGRILLRQKRFTFGLKVMEYALEAIEGLTPAQEHALTESLGDAYQLLGERETASDYYQTLIENPQIDLASKATLLHKLGLLKREKVYFHASLELRRQLEGMNARSKKCEAILIMQYASLFFERSEPKRAIEEYKKSIKIFKSIYNSEYRWEIVELQLRIGNLSKEIDPLFAFEVYQTNIKRIAFLSRSENHELINSQLNSLVEIIRKIYPTQIEKKWLNVCENLGLTAEKRKEFAKVLLLK